MYNNFLYTFYDTAVEKWNDEVMCNCLSSDKPITYSNLCARIMDYQRKWKLFGLHAGDKIAICSNSNVEWVILFMSILSSGYVAVSFSNDTQAVVPYIEHSSCSVLYVNSDIVYGIDFQMITDLKVVVSLNDGTILWSRYEIPHLTKKVKRIMPDELHLVARGYNDLALIAYTSGSSANIKGVMLSIGNLSANIYSISKSFPYKESNNYLSVLPFHHIFGLMYDVLMPICYGIHLSILNAPPVPSILFSALKKVNPTMFFAVPIVFYKAFEEIIQTYRETIPLLNIDERRAMIMGFFGENCKCLVTGGASVNREWLQTIYKDFNLPFFIGYGMSECASSICLPQLDNYKRFSCGKPIKEIEFKINSSDPMKIPGEIFLRGDVVFKGYYKNVELTRNAVDEDGWFHTNDLAIMSEDEDVFIVGRMNTMCVSASGKNIYLEDIEDMIAKIEGVADVVVTMKDNYLLAYVVRDKAFSEKYVVDSIYGINPLLIDGVFIQEVKWIDSVIRTSKGTIKRHLYI